MFLKYILFRKSGESQAITLSETGHNKLDKKFVSHKWLQYEQKNPGELFESTEVIFIKKYRLVFS